MNSMLRKRRRRQRSLGGKSVGCIPKITVASYWTASQGSRRERKLLNLREEEQNDIATHKGVSLTSQWLLSPSREDNLYTPSGSVEEGGN